MVPDPSPVEVGAAFPFAARREQAEPEAVQAILTAIGTGRSPCGSTSARASVKTLPLPS